MEENLEDGDDEPAFGLQSPCHPRGRETVLPSGGEPDNRAEEGTRATAAVARGLAVYIRCSSSPPHTDFDDARCPAISGGPHRFRYEELLVER